MRKGEVIEVHFCGRTVPYLLGTICVGRVIGAQGMTKILYPCHSTRKMDRDAHHSPDTPV